MNPLFGYADGRSRSAILCILCVFLWGILMPTTTNATDAQVSDEEIRDMMRWGIEHNRTPEDIQNDIDGLNQARGGTGRVPLPVDLESIETPAGRVTVTQPEAESYRQNQAREEWLRWTAESHKDALKTLEQESGKWAGLAQLAEWRAAAAYTAMQEAYGDLQADLLLIKAKVLATNRKPTRHNFGWAYKNYATLPEALEAWRNRQDKLDALHAERALVQSEFVDKIRKMTDPDPKSVEGTSMLNRPNAKLDEIGEWQDYHRGIITETREEIAGLIAEREQLERRAAGTGGPPPVIPEPQPTPQPTPTEQPATGTATGSEGGDTDSATAGGRPVHPGGWVRRDTDTSGGTTGGSGGAGDGGSGGSIGDMLREFGGDEEGGGSGGGTVTVGEELLVDIQGQFDNAFAELEQCRHEFDGRMNALMGLDPAEICADPVLASAYSCIQSNFDRCSDLYGEAHSQLTAASRGRRWDKMGMESDVMSEDESGINPMDQITIILINTKYQSASGALGQSRERLFANAPGCDPEDLTGGSGTTAGGDDGSGTGGGGTGGGGTGNGGGSTGGTGGTDGGGTGEEGYYFAKLAGPQYHSGGTEAHCGGGSLKITQSGEPDFPDEIHPGDNITVRLPVSWTASSGVEEVKVVISIFFMDPANIQQKEYRALRGNSQGVYQFSANNVDFSREGGVITIVYGGSVDCEEESAETGGTIYTQAYQRVGH